MSREELRAKVAAIYEPLRRLMQDELKAAEIAELKTYVWAGAAWGGLELALQSLRISLHQLEMEDWRKMLEESP